MDKIDLIIDALEKAQDGWQCFDEYEKALAAARELKALKPVAWMMPDYGDVLSASEADGTGIYNIPLFTAPPKPEQEELIQFKDGKWSYVRKPWIGLTDIDIHVLKMNYDKVKVVYTDRAEDLTVLGQDVDVNGLINAIQTKLKELNT